MGRPTSAFALSLIGGLIYVLVGGIVAAASSIVGSLKSFSGISGLTSVVEIVGVIGAICGVVMILGAIMIYSGDRSRVKLGAILVLVFTIIGALFTAGGVFIGFILGLVGSIMGLVWKPSEPPRPTQPMM